MLDTDDLAPPPKPVNATPDLAVMSISELEARIETLKAEIERIKGVIEGKRAQRGLAEAFFKQR